MPNNSMGEHLPSGDSVSASSHPAFSGDDGPVVSPPPMSPTQVGVHADGRNLPVQIRESTVAVPQNVRTVQVYCEDPYVPPIQLSPTRNKHMDESGAAVVDSTHQAAMSRRSSSSGHGVAEAESGAAVVDSTHQAAMSKRSSSSGHGAGKAPMPPTVPEPQPDRVMHFHSDLKQGWLG